jgi:HEAT repeat protein
MEKDEQLSKGEKTGFLTRVIEGEDYSTDYWPMLREYLEDKDAEVRSLALDGLWDYPVPELIAPLLEIARNDPSQEVRSKAIVTLGRYIYEGDMADYDFDWGAMEELMREDELPEGDFLRVKDFLLELVRDEGQPLDSRRFAIEALSFLNEPEVQDLIEAAYTHPDVKMKVSAIFAMGRQGNQRWADTLLKELDSEVKELQYEAVRAAGEAYLDKAFPRLEELALVDDKDLQLEAIWSLGKIGGEGVSEFLYDLADDEDEEIREVAEAALEELDLWSEDVAWDEFGHLGKDDESWWGQGE